MANRYDIVRIDFQASARGANAAIESLRKEAEKSSAKLNEMRDNIDKAFKAGESDEVIAGMRAEAKAEERRYNQLTQAQNELIKGMRVLDQGVKMFNDGSLNQMNAAFQKAVNSAAKLAQSKMDAGSDTWRQMGALMQETEQNYARMQRDTEQLVQVIQNGGTVFKNTLEQEKKGLQELMGLVPYMGTEYQRLEGYLQTVTAKLEQMTIAERQHRGEIATTNDARRVSYQLTEEGAAAAKREAEAAEQTIAAGKQRIALLEEERSKRESAARATAEAVAKRNEDLAMQEGVIKSLEKEIQNEDRKGKKKRKDAAVAKKAAEESAKAVDTEKAALEGLQATTKAADEKVKQLEEDLKKLELAEQQQTSSQQLKKGIETLTGDINSLSDAIKALKDQRDALTASQNQGAEAAAKDAKAIQMTKEEAQAARDEMIKKSSIRIKTNGDVNYSNLEEVQSFIISKINGNVNEKGLNSKPELAKKGVFQLENPNQVKNLVNMLRERYGIEEKSDAVNILKGLVSGKEGGIFGKGFVDMESGQLKIQTNEKRGERIARMKELNAIIKGTTQATEQHTTAIEKNAEAEKRQVEVEQQKAALFAQITALEEQRQQKQEQLNQLQQQATQTSASQTNSIESLAEEEKKLIQLQKELKQAMTDAGYADKSPDKIDVFASMNRSARTGLMNEAAHSRIWAHHFGGDSPMKDWVEGHAKTLAERDSYFTALSKETIKDSLSGYLTNNKTLADVKAMQAEWKKVASSFTNNPETNKGYYQDAVLYIDRLVEKTAQLKEIQEKRSAVKNQQAIVDGLKQQAESTEKTTQATEQSTDAGKKAVELTNQLTDAKKELATAQQNQEAQQKKVDAAIAKANSDKEKSVKMEEELAKASADKTAELEKEKKTLVEMEAAAQNDVEQNKKQQEELRKTNEQIAAEGNIIREAETKKVQAQTNSIKATEEAIRLLREENNTIQFNSEQWRKNAADIQRLEAALDKMKGQAALQMMTDRMGQVSRLSSSALTETKRFWETMVAGAEKGSQELKVFEGNLKVIAEEERQRNRAALEASAKRLNGGLGNLSQEELRQAINDAKLLQSSYKSTSKEAQELAAAIVDAEEHVKRYGVEAERAARKQEESDKRTARAARDKEEAEFQEQQSQQALMRQRIAERTSLSAAALVETKKYWQAVKDGAQAGTIEEEKAMQVMRMLTAEEQRRATIANEAQAGILSGNLSTYSEQEVRAAIEAGKQLIQTYKVGSDEANTLAKNIVNAEEYIKQYGVEAERAAVREAKAIEEANRKRQETNQLMEQQLQRDTGLSQSALKAQENYWQRLIDDPKVAKESLQEYNDNLARVHQLQEQMAKSQEKAAETERRLAGEIVTVNDALRQSEFLTKEENEERNLQAKINKDLAEADRVRAELNLVDAQQRIEDAQREIAVVDEELARQRELAAVLEQAGEIRKGLPQAQDDNTAALKELFEEKQKWLDLNDEVVKATVKVDELNEKRANTSNLKEQLRIREELNKAEEELSQAQEKAALQSDKLDAARKRQAVTAEKVKTIEESMSKVLGGRDYDTEKDKLDELENKHAELAETIAREKQERQTLASIAAETREKEQKAAIELAQSEKVTQESIEKSIAVLAKQLKTTDSNTSEYAEQEMALDKLRTRLHEMKGEWMSLGEASLLAISAGSDNFIATRDQMQKATQALERHRDTLVKIIQIKRRNGEETEREERNLKEVTNDLRRLRFEMDNAGMSSERMHEILDNPKSAKNIEELGAAVKRAQAELKMMEDTVGDTNEEYEELAKQTKKAAQRQKEMESQFKASASSFEKAWSRLKTYVGLYVGASVAMQKLTATMGDLMELSDKLGEVRKTTGFTADEVGRLSENLKKMDTRTSITGLLDLSVAAGQLGLKTQEDVQGFTEAANKLMVALPEMGREGATEMLKVALATGEIDKIRKQMEQGIIEGSSATAVAMEKVGSTIDRLRATSASTAPAITDFVKRVGAVGAQSGITIDQVAALGSTVDALGMRVEMSATALSRMIPAIKNNAFDVAKAIGVAPETLRSLFDAGRGMEAILMIFQHIKDSGMGEDSIEKMLGMGNMKEVMKELNQQGARAGIVFAGLSQNVDELRRQLGIASTAYEENIAIEQEYQKMNETTAARWERLKNQLEETFVGDDSQRALGWIIDRLRNIIDLLTGSGSVSVALRTIITYLGLVRLQLVSIAAGALKGIGTGLRNVGVMLGFVKGEMTKLQWGNIFTAAAGAVIYLLYSLKDLVNATSAAKKAIAEANNETEKATFRFYGYYTALVDTRKALLSARSEHSLLSAEVDKLRKSTDGSAAATAKLNEKQEMLEKSERKVAKASNDHRGAIANMNSIYGQYLGFLLTEYDRAELVAAAHDKVTAAIRREMLAKQQQAALDKIDDKYTEDLAEDLGGLSEELTKQGRLNLQQAAKAKRDLQKFMRENISYNQQTGKYTYTKSSASQLRGLDLSGAGINDIVALWFDNYLKSNFHLDAQARSSITGVSTRVKDGRNEWQRIYTPFHSNLRSDYASTYNDRLKEQTEITDLFTGELSDAVEQDEKSTKRIVEELKRKASDASARIANAKKGENTGKAYEDLASALEGLDRNIGQLDPVRNAQLIRSITAQAENLTKTVDAGQLSAARTRVSSLFSRATGNTVTNGAGNRERPFGGTGTPSTNIWGSNASADSTDYATWDVNELVARRNQMDKFKNILKPDTDIRAVLAEDKALMKALDNGLKEDWKSVLGWYNTERKKIQQELKSERFSTNEGHWRDEKNGKGRRNPLLESDYALAELDRYYSRRKEALEKARSEENISEELYNRQLEMMEQEHLERRSKLRGTFTGEVSKAETAAFRKWWENLEKMDELDHVPWATVESEWSKATAAQIGRNNLKMQQDMTQVESITMKHVNQIAKIIAKERPYDGITENLQANLTRMDILFADMGAVTKKQLEDGSLTKELSRRLSFLLGEAEHAYTLTVDQLDRDMREKGFTAWADALAGEDGNELKRQMLAQLQTAYDAVQDAVKKEATLIKKQAEIQWNDTVLANGQSQKQAFESTLSALGLQEDQVKRANSLIGAGQASERIADKLAIKQMQVRLAMQEQYYALIRKIGSERIAQLEAAGKLEDAEHLRKSLNLALSEEQKKLDEQRVGIANQLEESQNRLYTELRSWADLLASSMRSLFEASHAGDAEYYNERAKLNLTGKGGPGAGTYVVIDNEGTSDAKAHYEYLNEREALDRQREIERQNALAEAWRKVMDDINMKMSETITDIMNATLQNASVDTNTDALDLNTSALGKLTGAVSTLAGAVASGGSGSAADLPAADDSNPDTWPRARRKRAGLPVDENPHDFTGSEGGGASPVFLNPEEAGSISWVYDEVSQAAETSALRQVESLNKVDYALEQHFHKQVQGSADAGTKMAAGTQSAFAKMTQAANLYGIAYQAMSNDNLSATQKFEMIAIQAAGQAAITSLTTSGVKMVGDTAVQTPSVLSKIMAELGPIAGPVAFGAFTALLGGLMGLAMSKLTKAKSQIASVTGAGSVGAGRLSTGMLTYAAGNVNEFTDPSTLTPGRTYNVDAADGKTYRAKYMGKNPRTHITNGPEFHLAGEAGREAIIDARTTRHITMNEGEIWRTIQTLSAGGRIRHSARRGGVAAFADGNIDDFDGIASNVAAGGMSTEQAAALQASIDRQNDLLERALTDGIKGVFDVHGPDGLVASYDKGKRMAQRHGEKY